MQKQMEAAIKRKLTEQANRLKLDMPFVTKKDAIDNVPEPPAKKVASKTITLVAGTPNSSDRASNLQNNIKVEIESDENDSEVLDLMDIDRNVNNILETTMTVDGINLPVINVQNVECKSDFERAVLAQLAIMSKDIAQIRQLQHEQLNYLIDKKVLNINDTAINLNQKYNITIPLTTMDSFLELEENLKSNVFIKNDVCLLLRSLLDKNCVMSKSFVSMLKKFFTKDLALQFTSVRKSKSGANKQIFKFTELCKCMDGTIAMQRRDKNMPCSDAELITALSDVLCNVKKWDKVKK